MKAGETLAWIIYDISSDKARAKIAKTCKKAGLYRVQYSAFVGAVNRNALDELALEIESLMEETDRVYIFPMCEADFQKCRLLGEGFDKKLVKGDRIDFIF